MGVCDRLGRLRLACHTSHVYSGVMIKVVIRGDQCVASSILEADSVAIVDAIETLDCCDDRFGRVMCVHQNSEWDPCPGFGSVVEEQFEAY